MSISASFLSTHLSRTMSKFLLYRTSSFRKNLQANFLKVFLSFFDAPRGYSCFLKKVLDVVIPRFVVDDCFYCKNMSGPIQAHNIDLRNVIPMIYPNHGRECG